MEEPAATRRNLGEFLRSRRARLTPQSAGLRSGARRRVPGLRREELAQLAGISAEYYQRLEQGRVGRPSDEVLNALADALRLDEVEREHLRALTRPPRRGPRPPVETGPARPGLRRMLALMPEVPAMVINDRFDVLALNPAAERVFSPAGGWNLARFLFLAPAGREFYLEWEETAATTAGQLRLALGRDPEDGALAALVEELLGSSPEFRELWATGDVDLRGHGTKAFRHPTEGVLTFHYENFTLPASPGLRLITFAPAPSAG
ncbi:helix-turn-helix transcriptional regulator [Streptomyces sp. DSM 44917]|uniref:Helix-turn-helix transcriptional regulator n=1 Tax=Streptomyces boetiae TaxID=3075541 RepID=A0ABU2LA28_9ACTN|nr:helix-turn-helix transcriptional regulator [Streptomyces sp. DSM 44917]MDT0308434.1 helix-turn-helix transcriptional regulator [Streptomyces sp. DSM 44917]